MSETTMTTVFCCSIPVLEASGKLDKSALPPFDKQSTEQSDIEGRPTTDTEIKLAQIWTCVLQIRDIDIQESFFDMGGSESFFRTFLNSQLLQFCSEH